jgi:methylated-DNA-[protein]-cysteine S-methyltransferase
VIGRPTSAGGRVRYRVLPSPDGDFLIVCDDEDRLVETGWVAFRNAVPAEWRRDDRLRYDLVERLRAALAGQPVDFSAEPLPDAGPFHLACRRRVQSIPPGETRSYGEIAALLGKGPGAARAVGQAMRRNPTPIVVPCHRVVGTDGALVGFGGATSSTGRELALKVRLIERERSLADRTFQASVA